METRELLGGEPPVDVPHGLSLGAEWNFLGKILCVENLDPDDETEESPTMAPQAKVSSLAPLLTEPAVEFGGKTFRLTPEEYGFFHQRCVGTFGEDHTAADWVYDILQLSNMTGEVKSLMKGLGIEPCYGQTHTIVTYQTGQYVNGQDSDGQDVQMTLFVEYQPDRSGIPLDFEVLASYQGLSLSAPVDFIGKVLCVNPGED